MTHSQTTDSTQHTPSVEAIFGLSPSVAEFPVSGGQAEVSVMGGPDWQVVYQPLWVVATTTDPQGFTLHCDDNPTDQIRSDSAIVAKEGKRLALTIVQRGNLLEADRQMVQIPSGGGAETVIVRSSRATTAMPDPSAAGWLHATLSDSVLTLEAGRNSEYFERMAPVMVHSAGQLLTLYVIQPAGNYIIAGTDTILATEGEGDLRAGVSGNVPWTVSSSTPWLTYLDQSSDLFRFRCQSNSGESPREGVVVLTTADTVVRIVIIQEGLTFFTATPVADWEVAATGGDRQINIQANKHWYPDGLPEWIEGEAQPNGLALRCLPNIGGTVREHTVRIVCGTVEKSFMVRQAAE